MNDSEHPVHFGEVNGWRATRLGLFSRAWYLGIGSFTRIRFSFVMCSLTNNFFVIAPVTFWSVYTQEVVYDIYLNPSIMITMGA